MKIAMISRLGGVEYFFGKGGKIGRRTSLKEAIMKGERLQKECNGLSEEIVEGIAEWRGGHPKATFREIEAEIDKRLSVLRAKMISDTANQSVRADWGTWRFSAIIT